MQPYHLHEWEIAHINELRQITTGRQEVVVMLTKGYARGEATVPSNVVPLIVRVKKQA